MEAQRVRAYKATYTLKEISGRQNRVDDKIPCAVECIMELEKSLEKQIEQCTHTYSKVIAIVKSIPDARAQEIFRYRYILGKTWEDIANQMKLSSKWVKVIHDRQLYKLRIL